MQKGKSLVKYLSQKGESILIYSKRHRKVYIRVYREQKGSMKQILSPERDCSGSSKLGYV